MRITFTLLVSLFVLSLSAQGIKPIGLSKLEAEMNKPSDHLRIYNFWASWCGPCIKEMPHFQSIDQRTDTEVILVSLDFPEEISKANKILNKKNITLEGYLLNEKDIDKYISAINKEWTGAIPASMFIESSGNRHFYEHSFEQNELESLVINLTSK